MLDKQIYGQGLKIMGATLGWSEPLHPDKSKDYRENRELFYHAVQHLTDDEFRTAVDYVVKHNRFFPKPFELIDVIKKGNRVSAHEAWEQVREKAYDYKATDCRDLDAITQKAVASMGGLRHLKEMDWEAGEQFIRRDFIHAYEQIETDGQYKPELIEGQAQERIGEARAIGAILDTRRVQ